MTGAPGSQRGEKRAGTTQQRVYQAWVSHFAELGYHGSSVRQVANDVGLQVGSIYHHFGSKQEILFRIISDTLEELYRRVNEKLLQLPPEVSHDERLRWALGTHTRAYIDLHEEAFVAATERRALSPENTQKVVELQSRYETVFINLLEQLWGTGIAPRNELEVVIQALLEMCTGLATRYAPGVGLSLPRVIDLYEAIMLNGVLTPITIGEEIEEL